MKFSVQHATLKPSLITGQNSSHFATRKKLTGAVVVQDSVSLPLLESVEGDLIVYGENADLPRLRRIEGYLAVHGPSLTLPALAETTGDVIVTSPECDLPAIVSIGGHIRLQVTGRLSVPKLQTVFGCTVPTDEQRCAVLRTMHRLLPPMPTQQDLIECLSAAIDQEQIAVEIKAIGGIEQAAMVLLGIDGPSLFSIPSAQYWTFPA